MFRRLALLIVLISLTGCGREEQVNLPPPRKPFSRARIALMLSIFLLGP
jgi:predicted small lipoprotein YifL